MRIIETVEEMQYACRSLRTAGETVGLVPTMGALHEGHLSLVRTARSTCQAVAASIFVNPLQFAANEDLGKYPRTFEADCAALDQEGIDLLFAPGASEMYRPGAVTWVEVGGIGDRLDGASRPGHFRGVATVVAKLFHIVGPTHAFFGQKDAAQLAVLRRMVRDLNFDLEIVSCPIVREPDGLAMSSRNRYLSPQERQSAPILYQALQAGAALSRSGQSSPADTVRLVREMIGKEPAARIDYVAVVDSETLEELPHLQHGGNQRGAMIAVAAYFGATRLIDNVLL